jgi:hypothetical protein
MADALRRCVAEIVGLLTDLTEPAAGCAPADRRDRLLHHHRSRTGAHY